MSVNISNKKYAILEKKIINNQDIIVRTNGNYYADDGYTGLGTVRVQIPEPVYEEVTISPKITAQTIYPNEGYDGITKITVNPVTSAIDSNIKPENIVKGITILGVNGTFEYLLDTITIQPKTTQQVINPIHDGYTTITVKPVTSSIDSNIKDSNILKGVTILGVTGNVIASNETTRDIYTNGLYTPPSPYTGFSEVNVDVKVEQDELIIEPSLTTQTFTAVDEYHGYSPVTVKPVTSSIDEDIIPTNIRKGVNILGVNGSIDFEELTVSPSITSQVFTPNKDGYNKVTVNPVTAAIDTDIKAENIKQGVEILGITGSVIELKGHSKTVDPTNSIQTILPSAGYNALTSVTVNAVNSDIDTEIKPENIKQGVTILGVTGTCIELKGQSKNVSLTKTTTTTITPDSQYNGIISISITPTNKDLTVNPTTSIQTITVPTDYSGHGTVRVNPVQLQSKTITVNSSTDTIINVTPDNSYMGLSSVKLDMSWIEEKLQELNAGDSSTSTVRLQDKTISSAGTYTCDSGYDGLGNVIVNLDWVDRAIEQAREGTPTGDCDGLIDNTAIEIVTDADYVRQYAFYKATNLKRVFLNNANSIQQYAFADSGLQSLTIKTQNVCTLQSHAFDNTPLTNIYVPSNLLSAYLADTNWAVYESKIQPIS